MKIGKKIYFWEHSNPVMEYASGCYLAETDFENMSFFVYVWCSFASHLKKIFFE